MKKLLILLLFIIVLFTGFSVGCSAPKVAENVTDSYYQFIKNKDFDQALTLYSPKFFEKTPRSEINQALNNINNKLGDLQAWELVSWKITRFMGTGELESGTYYVLQYKVEYSKFSAQETLTLLKPSSGGDILIIGFNINSSGFLK